MGFIPFLWILWGCFHSQNIIESILILYNHVQPPDLCIFACLYCYTNIYSYVYACIIIDRRADKLVCWWLFYITNHQNITAR